jgi:hypothetical protein
MTAGSASSVEMAGAPESRLDEVPLRALAREVAELLASDKADERLLTARQVAARFNVERSWVYAHAEELGVVRIGNGPRPRLRFEPAVVAQRLLPTRGRTSLAPASKHIGADVALLPIGPARRRTLGAQR